MTDIKARIGIVDGGAAYHIDSFERPPFDGYFDRVIYLRDIPLADLSDLDVLIVPCRTNPHWLGVVSEHLLLSCAVAGHLWSWVRHDLICGCQRLVSGRLRRISGGGWSLAPISACA